MGVPAPEATELTADALRACMEGTGTMLPAAAYVGQDVLAWENRSFFEAGWVCVGRSGDLGQPGARRAVAIGDDAVVLVRGKDGELRAFYNTCRHRGHELMPCGSQAQGSFIRCPYHAWVYDTQGRLHGVPPTHQGDVKDTSAFGLVPARVAEWQGFVFVNVSGDAPSLDAYLSGLDSVADPYDLAGLRLGDSHEYEIAANWKLVVENYDECFHCPSIHPELCTVSDPESGVDVTGDGLWIGGTMLLRDGVETMSLDGRSGGAVFPKLSPVQQRDIVYLHVFPNLLISLHPDYVMTHRMTALAPDRTWIECQWLFPEQAWERPGFDPAYAVDFWDITNRQDWSACESVQRGATSRGYRPGPFSSEFEYMVKSFVDMTARAYLAGGLPRVTPAAATVDV